MRAGGDGLGNEEVVILLADPRGMIGEPDIEMGLEYEMNLSGHKKSVHPTVLRTTRRVLIEP